MKKVIIGIHGLGNKPPKRLLEEWWKQSMAEGLAAIGKYHRLPEFVLVYWADVMYDKPLDPNITDKDNIYYLDEIYTPATAGLQIKTHHIRKKVTGFIARQLKNIFLREDLSLKNKAIAENIIKHYFHELDTYYKEPSNDENCVACKARKTMMERVVSTLQKYRKHDIFLIGHSMGSILCFDALYYEVPDIIVNTMVTIGSPLGMPNVISNIAGRQNIRKDGKSILLSPPSVEKKWYNFADIEDVISLNYSLSAEFHPNDKGVLPTDVLVTNNYQMNGKKNPHKSFGYLRTKDFAVVLSAFIEEEKPGLLGMIWYRIKTIFFKILKYLQIKKI